MQLSLCASIPISDLRSSNDKSKMRVTVLFLFNLLLKSQVNCFYVQYFAFGSNLNPDVLERRTLTSIGSLTYQRVVLDNYQLVFNHGSAAIGCSASVEPKFGSTTHGLLYKLNLLQFAALRATERGYDIEHVLVQPYEGGKRIRAATLRSSRNRLVSGRPSDRYIKLLQKGAREQSLTEEYQSFLMSVLPTNANDFNDPGVSKWLGR
jgi:hypothetical protein